MYLNKKTRDNTPQNQGLENATFMSTGIWGKKKKLKKVLYKKIWRKTMSGIMEAKRKDFQEESDQLCQILLRLSEMRIER